MKDRTELDITPVNSVFVESPSEFIYVVGKEYDFKTKKFSEYKGIIQQEIVDSVKISKRTSGSYHTYWLKGNRKIFSEKEMYNVTPDSGSGFWLVLDNKKDEIRKIYDTDIVYIKAPATNWPATIILIIAGVGILTYLILNAVYSSDGPLLSGSL